MMTNR